MEIKLNALMLRAVDYKDNDKILTLLSAERGKITAGIKGVRKAGAKLKFAAQPFCFAEYILSARGDMYTVIGASETEDFYDLRTDIGKFYAASAVCEVAEALTYEYAEDKDIFIACIEALSQMCGEGESMALIRFLLKALSLSGYGISTESCSECGANLFKAERMRFDKQTGSFTCWDCGSGDGASLVTYHTLRFAQNKPCSEACVSEEGKKRALRLLREYLAFKTDCKCSSLSEYIRLL